MSIIKFEGSEHFSVKELASPDTGEAYVHPDLIAKLELLRASVGFPLIITSGYRTKEWNEKIGGAKNSYHVKGMAVDIHVVGDKAYDLIDKAIQLGFNGIGVSQKLHSDYNTRFIHLDIRPKEKRFLWSY